MRLVSVASLLLVADLAAFALGFGLNLRTVPHGYNSRQLAKNLHTKVADRYGKNCGFARKCSKIAVNAADGRNAGSKSTIVPDSDLSGAWAEDGTRSKRWFEETELERQRKVVSVRVSHILITAEEMAEALMTQIRSGDDFSDLAKVISACEQSRAEGGAVGWVGRNDEHLDSILPEPVRSAALQQKPGDVIQCKSPLGIHLVKVEDIMYNLSRSSHPRAKPFGADGANYFRPLREMLDKQQGYKLTYWLETMGCQMNSADSERMAGQLDGMGMARAAEAQKADVVVYNTCSIRDHAESKVYSYIGPQAERKRNGESVAIVVAGCVAQQEGDRLLRRVPEIDLVMGPQYANRIGDLLEDVINGNQVVATEAAPIAEDVTRPRRESDVCAWVNIIFGCNERCTYCVVPTTRGVEQSRPRESIRKEIEELAAAGYKEVTLLGQNVDAWGRDMEPKQRFSDLLTYVSSVEGIERIRFVTSHPRYMSPGVVDAVAASPRACPAFHVPFQSGDDDILRAMGRGHTVEQYLQVVDRIRAVLPDAAVTADAIVGFPGETEEMFQNTLALMTRVGFDVVNTASYSPRPNTPAARWTEQLPEEVKADRLKRINRLGGEIALQRSQRYLGRVMDVLVEERNTKIPSQVKGRIPQGRPVFFDADADQCKGRIVPVRIIDAQAYYLVGEQAGPPR